MSPHTLSSSYYTAPSGSNTHFLHGGSATGPLIVCLHGLGGSTQTFLPLVPFLPPVYRFVLVDFPGFGKSPLADPSKPISVESHVADLGHFISSLQTTSGSAQPGKVVLIGHSLGAIVALHYAAQHAESVGGLALLGAGRAAGHIPAARQRMCDLATAVRENGMSAAADNAAKSNFYEDTPERVVDPAAREAVRKEVSSSDPEGYAQTCEAIVHPDHKDPEYENIVCPAVFVAGDKDMISPVERSRDLSALVGGQSWVEVVKSGHQPILEDLSGVRVALDKLFKAVDI